MAGFIAGSINRKAIDYSDLKVSMAAAVAVLHATTIKLQFHCLIRKFVSFLDLS
jgi:hypothetical protein